MKIFLRIWSINEFIITPQTVTIREKWIDLLFLDIKCLLVKNPRQQVPPLSAFNKCLMSIDYLPDPVLETGATKITKTNPNPCWLELTVQWMAKIGTHWNSYWCAGVLWAWQGCWFSPPADLQRRRGTAPREEGRRQVVEFSLSRMPREQFSLGRVAVGRV